MLTRLGASLTSHAENICKGVIRVTGVSEHWSHLAEQKSTKNYDSNQLRNRLSKINLKYFYVCLTQKSGISI